MRWLSFSCEAPACTCMQLLNWHKRRLCGDSDAAMYRITPQCASAPLYLVPKTVHAPSLAALDRRGVFVVRTSKQTIIWQAGAPAPLRCACTDLRHAHEP